MAYANAHVKVTLFGTCMSGNEEWQTGFRMGDPDPAGGNFGIGSGWLALVAAAWQTYFTNGSNGFSGNYKTNGVKAAIILEDGSTDIANVETYSYATPISGASGGSWFPPQITLSAQLAAASPVGLGAKGRMYLPGINFPISASGYIGTTEAQAIANGLRTFLDACETATNSPGVVMNCSKGRIGVPFAAPVNRRVTHVRVGSVYDTQRRRRNQLVESYVNADLAA